MSRRWSSLQKQNEPALGGGTCKAGSGNLAGGGTGKAGSARGGRPWAATLG